MIGGALWCANRWLAGAGLGQASTYLRKSPLRGPCASRYSQGGTPPWAPGCARLMPQSVGRNAPHTAGRLSFTLVDVLRVCATSNYGLTASSGCASVRSRKSSHLVHLTGGTRCGLGKEPPQAEGVRPAEGGRRRRGAPWRWYATEGETGLPGSGAGNAPGARHTRGDWGNGWRFGPIGCLGLPPGRVG
jgi:hypothetical protein